MAKDARGALSSSGSTGNPNPSGWVGWGGWAICPPDSRSLPGSAAPRTRLLRTWCWAGRDGQGPWPTALRKPVWPTLGVTLPHTYAHPSASSLLFLALTSPLRSQRPLPQSLHKGGKDALCPHDPCWSHVTHQCESQRHVDCWVF